MQAHDLFRKAESNAGSLRLGREEGDEDFFTGFFRDPRTIIRDGNQHPSAFIQVRREPDLCVRLTLHGMDRIKEEVDQDLLDQFRVGSDLKALRVHESGEADRFFRDLNPHQLLHLRKQFRRAENREFRFWNPRQVSVRIHEVEQSLTSFLNGLNGPADIIHALRTQLRCIPAVRDRSRSWERKTFFPNQLSGGQQQLIGIARAIITSPKLILADEPTGNLNSTQGEEIMALFKTLNQTGTTIIQVTHSEKNAAYGSRIINLLDGRVEQKPG